MKKRQGSALALVLIIFAMVMVLGTVSMTLAVSENNQSIRHENKTKAYYIARSGTEAVEAAIVEMDGEELADLFNSLPIEIEIKDLEFVSGDLDTIKISKESENSLAIESRGKVGDTEEILTKIVEWDLNEDGVSGIPEMESVIFGGSNINIKEWTRPIINGQIITNSDELEIYGTKVSTSTEQKVNNGNDTLHYDIVTGKNLEYADHNYNNSSLDQAYGNKFPEETIFNIPSLGQYRDGSFIQVENNLILSTSYQYDKFIVDWNKTLTIDTTKGDVAIVAKEFENRGSIIIKGNNKVFLYTNKINNNDNKHILREEGSQAKINIYHYGNVQNDLTIGFNIPGDLYIQNSNTNIHDGRNVYGNIYHYGNAGSSVRINGSVAGDIFIKRANLTIWYNGVRGENIYHFGDKNSKVIVNGIINGDVYVNQAEFEMHEDGLIKGSFNHFGVEDSRIKIKGKIDKNIYLSEGNLVIDSQNQLGGHIYYNGKSMHFENNGVRINGSIYAPNANIDIKSQILIRGGIIGDSININHTNIRIEGSSSYYPEIPPSDSGESKLVISPGYYK